MAWPTCGVGDLAPLPTLSLWLSVHLFRVCTVYEVYVWEVLVIQTLQQVYCFDEKASLHRIKHKLLLRSSVRLEEARYTKQMSVTLHNTILRLWEKTHIPAKKMMRQERALRFSQSHRHSRCTSLTMHYLAEFIWASQCFLGLKFPPTGYRDGSTRHVHI